MCNPTLQFAYQDEINDFLKIKSTADWKPLFP